MLTAKISRAPIQTCLPHIGVAKTDRIKDDKEEDPLPGAVSSYRGEQKNDNTQAFALFHGTFCNVGTCVCWPANEDLARATSRSSRLMRRYRLRRCPIVWKSNRRCTESGQGHE